MAGTLAIFELLAFAGDALKKSDVVRNVPQNPRLDAQVLLAHVLGVNSAYLFTHGDESVPFEKVEHFQRLVARRARHEPIAYILQTKAFFGRNFFVNRHVLIPRPETEVLVEAAIKTCTAHSTIIDIGTGSGAIAISLALTTHAPTFAIDDSQEAIAVATHNAQHLHAPVQFLAGSLFSPFFTIQVPSNHLVITANLPYLTPWQWQTLDPDVRDYEPQHALVGGADGLALYDELSTQIRSYLHEQSRRGQRLSVDFFIEIDPSQRLTAPALLHSHFPQGHVTLIRDLANKERIVRVNI